MIDYTEYKQGDLLRKATNDLELRKGICAALADYWLRKIRRNPEESAADRIKYLSERKVFAAAMQHFSKYLDEWYAMDGKTARALSGARLGMAFDDEKTRIMAVCQPLDKMLDVMMRDVASPGNAVAWDLRFHDRTGHAIAGFSNIDKSRYPITRMTVHIFDPNYGEFIDDRGNAKGILEMLARFYGREGLTIQSVVRMGANL